MNPSVEPAKYQEWHLEQAREAVEEFKDIPGGLMPALHRLQEIYGYLDEAALPLLAKTFNLSRAEVHGVASFYHDFKRTKPGKYLIKVCQAESCQAMGSEKLTAEIKSLLGIDFHETTESGDFTLEPVYCLGNCACSPNIMVGAQTYGRVTVDGFKTLAQALKEKAHG